MSENLCIDPSIYHNPQTLSCESPEAPIPAPQAQGPSGLDRSARMAIASAGTPRVLNLQDYTSQILAASSGGRSLQVPQDHDLSPLFLGFFALTGCSTDGSTTPSGTDATTGPSDAGTDSGGADATGGTDASTGDGGDFGDGGTDGGTDDPPIPGMAVSHDTTPCGTDGFSPDIDDGYGVCANYGSGNHHLFQWDPSTAGALASLLPLSYAPDQVLRAASGEYLITNYGNAAAMPPVSPGLAIVNTSMGFQSQTSFVPVPVSGLTSAGNPVTQINPTQPKGLAQVGDRIFIATSNGVPNIGDPTQSFYNPGTVVVFDQSMGNWFHGFQTTDYNPTSVTVLDGALYVVNSGDINASRTPVANTPSSIDVFNPVTLELIENIPLGTVGAGIHGEIAVSPDGKTMILPTGDNSGRILVVNLETKAIQEITVASGDKVLLTGLSLHESGDFAYVGNFNDGNLYTIDLTLGTVIDTQNLDAVPTDISGISDGLTTGGSVFMGVGPEIYQAPLPM